MANPSLQRSYAQRVDAAFVKRQQLAAAVHSQIRELESTGLHQLPDKRGAVELQILREAYRALNRTRVDHKAHR